MAKRDEIGETLRSVIDNYLKPVIDADIKRLEGGIYALADRLETVEAELRQDPRKGLTEDLAKLEARARLLREQLEEEN